MLKSAAKWISQVCSQVSKSWNVLALDGSNWQKVDLFEFQVKTISATSLYPQYFLKNSHVLIEEKKMVPDHKQEIILVSSQVDVEGIVVENLARRCGGFLKSLSLNGCQVNIHQNILITTKVPDNIRQWATLPCQHLPSIATTLSD